MKLLTKLLLKMVVGLNHLLLSVKLTLVAQHAVNIN